jgi:hypothetical protein
MATIATQKGRGATVADDFSLKIIACETLRDELSHVAPDIETEWVKGGLHDYPDQMRDEINKRIAETPGRRTILLGYGRCSNGTAGLQAGPHRLVLPAIDDCISLILGSRRRYLEEFTAYPGTYYYTRGWVEELEDPYQEYEKMIPRIGEEKAREVALMIMQSYTRLVLVETGTYDMEKCERYVKKVAQFYDLPIEMLPGDMRLFHKLVKGPWDEEFIVVEPGGVLEESVFWNLPSDVEELPEDPDAAGVWGPPITVEAPCEACAAGCCCGPSPDAADAEAVAADGCSCGSGDEGCC